MSTLVRPAAVAGTFYTGDPRRLAAEVDAMVAAVPERGPAPAALIAPHAGHVYSGPIAASGYARLRDAAATIRSVVLLGPAHRVPVRSMALSSADAFRTPLGDVPVDAELRARAAALPGVVVDDAAHAAEHSLEVHLPFLQRVLEPGWTLLPVLVGGASPEQVAALLDAVRGGPETLLVISSDLSHYEPYGTAARHDAATAAAICEGRLDDLDPHDACGAHPVRGLLALAQRLGWRTELVDLRSSGDTAGDRSRVVGYGTFLVGPGDAAHDAAPPAPSADRYLQAHELDLLVDVAEEALVAHVRGRAPRLPQPTGHLADPGAAFVTLRRRADGALLGCIGSLEPRRPLLDDVAGNAVAAGTRDPRFAPVDAATLAGAEVHVSVLTPLEPLEARDRGTLARALRPGIDGVLVEAPGHRGTFLPSVWAELGDDRDVFLAHLWRKAGLPPGSWPRGLRAWRYRTEEAGRPVRSVELSG